MKRSPLVLFALLATACVHVAPKPPAQPTPRPTPAPTALPSPTPKPAPAMPAKVVAWFREGGAVDEGLCVQNPALWNVTACDHGYREIAPLGNAHTTPDCQVNGTDTTLDDEIACWQLYIPTIESDYPGEPWIITIDERGRQVDQYALYPWCKDRWCAVTGSDEWCDASASKANVKAQVDAYHAETVAAYGHPLPVIGVLGPQAMTEAWCDGWTEWDIVAPELYALPPTTPDQMDAAWSLAAAMVSVDQLLGACLQAYSRNGVIMDPQQMASYPARGWQVAARNGRVRFVIAFSGWRVYGTQYHRPILGPVARWGDPCYLAGTDCANPPVPSATPAPTPKPTPIVGPGSIVTPSVNVVFPAGTTTVNVDVGRKDGTKGEIVLSYSVTCDSIGDDCTGGNVPAGALTFPDGSVGATMYFPVPPQTQPGQRVWLVRLLSVSNGGQIDSGPGPSHFHVTVAPEATDASVNFWLSSGLTIPGNPWGVILTRGDCQQPASGTWCIETGSTLVDGVDYSGSGFRCGAATPHPTWEMAAGGCQWFGSLGTLYSAISGHSGVLTIMPDDPTRRVGKMAIAVQ